jgi:4-aminobutyrate aminotransferase and related aminotransferases
MMPAAPKSTDEVFLTCGCGSSANEFAYKIAFQQYKKNNPSSSNPEIISFEKGFHGRLFGTLATSRSKAVHRVGIPTFR